LTALDGIYQLKGSEPLFADWYTGILRIPTGPMIDYFHGGFGSTFETELFVEVRSGVVTKTRKEHNDLQELLAAREAAEESARESAWERNRQRAWTPVEGAPAILPTDWTPVVYALDAKYSSFWSRKKLPKTFKKLKQYCVADEVIRQFKRFGVIRQLERRGIRGVPAFDPSFIAPGRLWASVDEDVIVSAFLGALESWAAATDVSTQFLDALRKMLPAHRHGMYFYLFSDIANYIGTPVWNEYDKQREQAAAQIAARLRELAREHGVRINDYVWNCDGSLRRRAEHTLIIPVKDSPVDLAVGRVFSDVELTEYARRGATPETDAKLRSVVRTLKNEF
jgi:hypothetical protein